MSIYGFSLVTEGILPTKSYLDELFGMHSYCKNLKKVIKHTHKYHQVHKI